MFTTLCWEKQLYKLSIYYDCIYVKVKFMQGKGHSTMDDFFYLQTFLYFSNFICTYIMKIVIFWIPFSTLRQSMFIECLKGLGGEKDNQLSSWITVCCLIFSNYFLTWKILLSSRPRTNVTIVILSLLIRMIK